MWYIDTTRIFVEDKDEEVSTIIARLQPLISGTVLQVFGFEDAIIKLQGVIVGSGDFTALKAMGKDGDTHTLSGPYGAADYYISRVKLESMRGIRQTLRQDLASDAQVFKFDMELYE